MNEKLYDAASKLGDAELRADRGAFFKSVLGTLNHLVVTDIIWLKRFAGHPSAFPALQFLNAVPNPPALNHIAYDDLGLLRQERRRLDAAIIAWQAEMTAADLDVDLDYANTKGAPFKNHFGGLVQHLFNHQTHHRGQITTLLSQAGVDVGSTDLLTLIRAN